MRIDRKNPAIVALDRIIKKSRIHLYKPIQIAEILFHHRSEGNFKLADLEAYRNRSKRWRDDVSMLLVGNKSTSSQKYQDNVFEPNAMPPKLLATLGDINKKGKGLVEAYIYNELASRLSSVHSVGQYIREATVDDFQLTKLVGLFQTTAGLKRSVDKIYEILVYALFSTIVRALKAQITLELGNKDEKILADFDAFIKLVLGLDSKQTKLVLPASLYRVGVTNAADTGLDICANFGTAIQVKHLTLTLELAEEISDNIAAGRIVIVCFDAEKAVIESLLRQVGWGEKIQGIITINDLENWYGLCLSAQYKSTLGESLLADISREFAMEFPSNEALAPFIKKRGYHQFKF